MRILYCLGIFLLYLTATVYSQGGGSNKWYFGINGGLDFSQDPPVPLPGSPINTNEGCSSVSDNDGNVLFYTDGKNVWYGNHQPVILPGNLNGDPSSQQTALIIPIPEYSCTRFFVFTTGAGENPTYPNGLSVSVLINNNGVIQASPGEFNIVLQQNMSEKLCFTSDGNGGYWLLAHSYDPNAITGNRFFAYHITSSTTSVASLIPVVTTIGEQHTGGPSQANTQGQMKFSLQGNRVGLVVSYLKICELFDFDVATGILSNNLLIDFFSPLEGNPFGFEFSPSGQLFYVAEGFTDVGWTGYFYQFNLADGTPLNMWNNRVVLDSYQPQNTSPSERYPFNSLEFNPDLSSIIPGYTRKIYMARMSQTFLSVINNPDISGIGCNFSGYAQGQAISGTSGLGLPTGTTYVPDCNCREIETIIAPDTCDNSKGKITLNILNGTPPYAIASNGNPGSITFNEVLGLKEGNYNVLITDAAGCMRLVSADIPNINPAILTQITSSPDTCSTSKGSIEVLPVGGYAPFEFQWAEFPLVTGPLVSGLAEGTYTLTLTDALGCDTTLIIPVQDTNGLAPFANVVIPDTCLSGSGCIDISIPNASSFTFEWSNPISDTSTSQVCQLQAGNYQLTLTDPNGCTGRYSYEVPNVNNFEASLTVTPKVMDILNPSISVDETNPESVSWFWMFGDGAISNQQQNLHTYQDSGYYLVTVIAENHLGCVDTVSAPVRVNPLTTVYIPNSFTPNQNGDNDEWGVFGADFNLRHFELRVYDRWGMELWHTKNPSLRWNGKYRNSTIDVPQGVYVYRLVYRDVLDNPHDHIGHISLVRMQ